MPKEIAVLTKQDADLGELLDVKVFKGSSEGRGAVDRALRHLATVQRDALLYPKGADTPYDLGWEDAKHQAEDLVDALFSATKRGDRFSHYVATRDRNLLFLLWEVKA